MTFLGEKILIVALADQPVARSHLGLTLQTLHLGDEVGDAGHLADRQRREVALHQ